MNKRLTLIFFATAVFFSQIALASPRRVTILHFNDFHAQFLPLKTKSGELGGAARLAGLISRIRGENWKRGWDTVVLFGGDAFMGSPISNELKGRAEMEFLKAIGVDAMVIGNHDFDYETARLEELIDSAKFPIISANIYWRQDGERFAEPFAGVVRYSMTLDVLGLTNRETADSVTPGYVDDLRFADPVREAVSDVRELSQRGNVIVALTHEGVDKDIRLAEKVKGLSAVIGGHDHINADEYCRTVNDIPVCQTPNGGTHLGRLDLEVDGAVLKHVSSELIPVETDEKEDPAVKKMVDSWEKIISKKYDIVIGRNLKKLETKRGAQSELGRFVADALVWKTGAEACFVNSGGIRRELPAGNVTLRDVKTILPFENRAVLYSMKGAKLLTILEYGIERGGGAYPQVANIDFDVEKNRPVNVRIAGAPLKKGRYYDICTIEYLAKGGDGYKMLKKMPIISMTDEDMGAIFAEYIKRQGVINR